MASITPRILIAAVSLLASLAFPALAGAVTQVDIVPVPGVGNVVVVNDDDSSATIDIENGITTPDPPPGNVRYVAVRNLAGVQVADPSGDPQCGVDNTTNPTVVACEGVYPAFLVEGRGGNDKITLDLLVNEFHMDAEVYGGAGDDELKATPDNRNVTQPSTYIEGESGNDTIVSGNGDDELHGGDGNDTMQGFSGPDLLFGEGGNDSVSGGKEEPAPNSADTVDGRPGFDEIPRVDADYNRGFDDNVSVSVDGAANDGEAGEGDNVVNVEKFTVTADNATITGSGADDDIFVEANSSTVNGLGGNDRLVTYDGADTILGGDGDDFIEAGFGNDVLDGGAGKDQFNGDRTETNVFAVGNDQIRARDGVSELVSCGLGADSADVDAVDVVDASCESVNRGPRSFGSSTRVTLALVSRRIPARGPLPVRIANANDFPVTGSVSGQTTGKVTVSAKRIVKLKAKRFSVGAKARKTVKLKLPAALRRELKRRGKLSLRLTVKVKDPAGATRTVKKKVTPRLKR